MVGISELKTLAARKQALVAQSEMYRIELTREIHNVRLYRAGLERKLRLLRFLKPLLFVVPVAGSVLGLRGRTKSEHKQPARGLQKWWGAALVGWRLYRQAAPVMAQLIARRRIRSRSRHERFGETTP